MTSPLFTQVTARARNDDGSESAATWKAAQGVDVEIDTGVLFRMRFLIDETNSRAWTNKTWNLYYSLNSGAYAAVTGSTPVQFALSGNFVDGADCTSQLTGGSGTFVTDNNGMKEATGGAVNSGSAGYYFEVEFCLKLDPAQVADADTIDLRIYDSSSAINAYTYTPRVTANEYAISGAGAINAGDAYGNPTLAPDLSATGLATAAAYGSPGLSVDLSGVGNVAGAEAFGSPTVAEGSVDNITNAGAIASAEALGSPALSLDVSSAGAIVSAETVSGATVSADLSGAGAINSAEAFGSPGLTVDLAGAGAIAGAEAFGSPTVTELPAGSYITDAGAIASAEAFGAPLLAVYLVPAGIAAGDLFGAPVFVVVMAMTGLASAEAFGTPTVGTSEAGAEAPTAFTNAFHANIFRDGIV